MNDKGLEELVIAARQGSVAAFGQLVERFQDMAYFTAFRYLGQQQPAQDAAQEAFIEAYRCLPSLEIPLAFPAWLRRIVFKQSDRQARQRRPLHLPDEAWANLPHQAPGPPQMLEALERAESVQAAIDSLPAAYRQVTKLFYLHGRSYQEIAIHLDLPLSTIKKRLYTARQQLKERLDPMTTTTYRPSQDETFARRVNFYLALKQHDLLQVRQIARRAPELLSTQTEWGVASDGWYWPLGVTALHWAASSGSLPLMTLLVELGADVNAPDQGGATPLQRAAHMGQVESVRWLLENGADPNLAAGNGQTPLHAAVIRRRPQIVEMLLAHGARPDVADSQGQTPFDWAVAKRQPVLAQLLGDVADLALPELETPTKTAVTWETGIKMLDLLAPLKWNGRNGLFTPLSGIGADVMMGELINRMALYHGGTAVQLGLAHGDFTAESRARQWRNYGVDDQVELFYGDEADSPARRRHLAEQGVRRAQELAAEQPVLLIVDTDLALSEGVIAIIEQALASANVTLLLAGIETIGAEPPALAGLDAAFTFDRLRAGQGWWPALHPVHSYSNAFENEAHRHVAETAVRLLRRYQDLHLIYQNQGMAGFDIAMYGEAERQAVIRGRRLHRFLVQPLVVAEAWSATPGTYVHLADTLLTAQAILNGEFDDAPEEEMSAVGRWTPAQT